MRYAFAGDRDVSVWVLDYLLGTGCAPVALLTPEAGRASHARQLTERCAHLAPTEVFEGPRFREPQALARLRELELDLIVGIHFPLIVPPEVLAIPKTGVLNLHPALLPYNRGWHTASWALLDQTPIGATLHFMDAGLDSGDIVHQRRLEPSPADTAHTLYEKLKRLELDVFREAWPAVRDGTFVRTPQPPGVGTSHRRRDLTAEAVQRIDLEETVAAGDLIRRLRALTTNSIAEAAYFESGGKRYRVQVSVVEEPADPRGPGAG